MKGKILTVLIVAALGLVILLVAGRAGTAASGPATIVGRLLPDMQFTAPDGKTRTISSYFDDATLVVLLNEPCSPAGSPLVRASEGRAEGLRFIEITTSGEQCVAHNQCVAARGKAGENVISVCDPQGTIRSQLGVAPAENMVLVLNSSGTIVSAGGCKDFARFLGQAKQMAWLASQDRSVRANW